MFIGDNANAIVVRWKLALMQHDFDIDHILSAENVIADYLSRLVKSPNHNMENNKNFNQRVRIIIWKIIKTSINSLY